MAEQFDRVHLRNTYYKYAEWLRETGDSQKAMKYFELAKCGPTNVSQMLMDDPVAMKVSSYTFSTAPQLLISNPFRKLCKRQLTKPF